MPNLCLILFQVVLLFGVWYFSLFICYGKFSDLCDHILGGGVILSGATLFVDLDKEELPSMPGDKILMSLGVLDLGVTSIFVVPGVVDLGFSGKISPGVTAKVASGLPMDLCSLYYTLIRLSLILNLNQVSALALTKFFYLFKDLDLDLDLDLEIDILLDLTLT